jgi:hypothetical protein
MVVPDSLNFGIVFLGRSREQKLVVHNIGTTAVLFATNGISNGSFSLGEDSFTLAPNEKRQLLVRFGPAASGSYEGSLTITSGSSNIAIPLIGVAVSYEEYLQMVLDSLQAAANSTGEDYGMAYAWDSEQRRSDFAVAGFPNMNSQEFQSLWDLAQNVLDDTANTSDPVVVEKIKQSIEILNTINLDDLGQWMEALKEALRQGRFDEEYAQLLPQGLDRYRDIFVTVWGYSVEEAKNLIQDMAENLWDFTAILEQQQLSPSQEQMIRKAMRDAQLALYTTYAGVQGLWGALIGLLEEIIKVLGIEGLPTITPFGLIDLMLARWDRAVAVIVSHGFDPNIAVSFSLDLRWLILHLNETKDGFSLLWRVGELAQYLGWMSSVSDPRRTIAERIEQGVGTIEIAVNAAQKGWNYLQLRLDTASNYTSRYGDWWGAALFLSRKDSISGRSIAALVRGSICENCGGDDRVKEIVAWVERALELLPNLQSDTHADVGVVGLVFTNPLADATGIGDVINGLFAKFGSKEDAAILVVWIDWLGQVWYVCVGGGCTQLRPEEAEQMACNLAGRNSGCGAKDWSIIDGPKHEQIISPPSFILEPVDWFEGDPWYFTREWLCSMTRGQAAGQGLEGLWDSLCG